jgi:FXSXX-COOH protein
MNDSGGYIGDGDVRSDLVDVTRLPLHQLVRSADTALDVVLRRVLHEVEAAGGNFAAFSSAMPEGER